METPLAVVTVNGGVAEVHTFHGAEHLLIDWDDINSRDTQDGLDEVKAMIEKVKALPKSDFRFNLLSDLETAADDIEDNIKNA